MKIKKVAGALVVLTIATMTVTSCGSDEEPAAVTNSSAARSDTIDPRDRYGEVSGPAVDEIEGTRYSTAVDGAEPWLESWIVAPNGRDVAYLQENCAGEVAQRAMATIKDGVIHWPAPGQIDPWVDGKDARSTAVTMSGSRIFPSAAAAGVATTDIEAQKSRLVGFCEASGKPVADEFAS